MKGLHVYYIFKFLDKYTIKECVILFAGAEEKVTLIGFAIRTLF
jgi:hypothetical protein